jgi:hypothetical protein
MRLNFSEIPVTYGITTVSYLKKYSCFSLAWLDNRINEMWWVFFQLQIVFLCSYFPCRNPSDPDRVCVPVQCAEARTSTSTDCAQLE